LTDITSDMIRDARKELPAPDHFDERAAAALNRARMAAALDAAGVKVKKSTALGDAMKEHDLSPMPASGLTAIMDVDLTNGGRRFVQVSVTIGGYIYHYSDLLDR
jgi:hypothetical protein